MVGVGGIKPPFERSERPVISIYDTPINKTASHCNRLISNGDDMIPLVFRSAVDTDFPYILDTFLNGARFPTFGKMVGKVYYRRYKPVLRALIKRSSVLIACLPEDPDTIVGYAVHEKLGDIPVLHWIHTRAAFGGQGIAREILQNCISSFGSSLTMVSHVPPKTDFYQLSQKHAVQLDPFLVYGLVDNHKQD